MKQKHRGKAARRRAARRRRRWINAAATALALAIIALSIYVAYWYITRDRILSDGERYQQMYPARSIAPSTVEPASVPTDEPTNRTTTAPEPTAAHIDIPTAAPTPTDEPTNRPTTAPAHIDVPTVAPTPAVTALAEIAETPTAVPADAAPPIEMPSFAVPGAGPVNAQMPVIVDAPIPTPDGDTLVYALPTPPPVQESFSELLAHNPDTVGYLDLDGVLSLPVVQRENDNEYYLNHTFDGAEALEGTLFLDGLNRLSPEDDCLIVYGHNMKNKTMFGKLSQYADVTYMRQHPVIHFDTLYENRSYVVFAAFSASMEPGSRSYFDVRKFIFDETEFEKFTLKLRGRSLYSVPVDVNYGDRLLLLVTCDYSNREGRFILALRQLRPDETEANLWMQATQATAK